jgi:glycerol 3-phosphatase-2
MNQMTKAADLQKLIPFDVAFSRYEDIRPRLPQASAPVVAQQAEGLLATVDAFDGYLFDSFGVLNVGDSAIAGAAECLLALRQRGKPFCILTNAASYTSADAFHKYARLGLDVRAEEIISSRDVLFRHLAANYPGVSWGAIAAVEDRFADTKEPIQHLDEFPDWDSAEGFLFLSAARWSEADQERLIHSLIRKPRPVLVGNPDLVAPREGGLTVEPGFWAHDLQDRTGQPVAYFGKPFPEAFSLAAERIGAGRLAMVGDTLHTDILGGQAAGHGTILVTDHGLFKGRDVTPFIKASGITPDWIIPTI